jgi:hypothetical protein
MCLELTFFLENVGSKNFKEFTVVCLFNRCSTSCTLVRHATDMLSKNLNHAEGREGLINLADVLCL